jgi:hypothetical protein
MVVVAVHSDAVFAVSDELDLASILAQVDDLPDTDLSDAPSLAAILADSSHERGVDHLLHNPQQPHHRKGVAADTASATLSAILLEVDAADKSIQLDIDRAVQSSLDAVDALSLADVYASAAVASSTLTAAPPALPPSTNAVDDVAATAAAAAAVDDAALQQILNDVSALDDALPIANAATATPVVLDINEAVSVDRDIVVSLTEPSDSSLASSVSIQLPLPSSDALPSAGRPRRRTRKLTTTAQDIARGLADTSAVVEVTSLGGIQQVAQQYGMPTAFGAHEGVVVAGTSRGVMFIADVIEADNSANALPLAPAAVDAALTNGSFGKRPDSPQLRRRALLMPPAAATAAQAGAIDAVTAVDASNDDDGVWCVAGHNSGVVRLWHDEKVLKTLALHAAPILRVAFLGTAHDRFLSLDTRGVMLLHIVRSRLLGGIAIDSPVVLDGSAGVVETLAVLRVPQFVSGDAEDQLSQGALALLDGGGLCSFATSRRVHIVSLAADVHDRLRYSGIKRPLGIADSASACLAWRQIRWDDADEGASGGGGGGGGIAKTGLNATDPELAVAWGAQVQFLRIISKVEFVTTGIWNNLPERSSTCGIVWLGAQAVAVVDELDRVTIVDPYELSSLQRLPMSSWRLVFHSLLSERPSFQASLLGHHDAALALCVGDVHRVRLLTWRERIALFVADGNLHAALELAKAFYEGTASVPSGAMAKEATSAVAAALLRMHAASVFADLSPAPSAGDTQKMRNLAMVCISCSIDLDRTHDLLGEMLPEFEKRGYGATYLEQLEPFMLANDLRSLSPIVIRQFVAHYASTANRSLLQRVEQCLLHLELGSIDFQQVALLCRRYQLFSALIFLNTRALKDYVTPLDEILNWLAAQLPADATARVSADAFADAQVALSKLLAFVECTLKGRAYPRGVIDSGDLPQIWTAMYRRLFAQTAPAVSSARGADEALLALAPELRDRARAALKQDYAGLRALMYFGAKDSLRVLAMFMDARVARDAGVERAIDADECLAALATVCLQFDVDPFENEARGSARAPFTPTKLAPLFDLISDQVIGGRIDLSDRRLLRHLLFYLLRTRDEQTAQHRQSTLLTLLPQLPPDALPEERLVSLAEQAEFHTICELVYSKRRDWKNVIKARLCSKTDRAGVFGLVSHLLGDKSLTARERQTVQSTTISCLKRLVEVDINATSQLLTTWFGAQHNAILEQLQPHPDLQYMYLKALLQGSASSAAAAAAAPLEIDASGVVAPAVAAAAGAARAAALPANLVEDFISLMCQHEPSAVKPFLEANDAYRIDSALRACEKYKVTDAVVFLLERTGDVARALTLLLEQLKQAIAQIEQFYEARWQPKPSSTVTGMLSPRGGSSGSDGAFTPREPAEPEKRLHHCVELTIQLCLRNAKRLDAEELASSWFRLLAAFFVPLRRAKARGGPTLTERVSQRLDPALRSYGLAATTSSRSRRDRLAVRAAGASHDDAGTGDGASASVVAFAATLTMCIHDVLSSMVGSVAMPVMLKKIVQDHGADELGDFRAIINGMLEGYTYEATILRITNRLLGHDIAAATTMRVQCATEAFSAGGVGAQGALRCASCGKNIVRSGTSVVLFRCGHVFDRTCAKGQRGCMLCKRRKRGEKPAPESAQASVRAAEATAAALAAGDTAAAAAAAAQSSSSSSSAAAAAAAADEGVQLYAATNDEYAARVADFAQRDRKRFEIVRSLAGL